MEEGYILDPVCDLDFKVLEQIKDIMGCDREEAALSEWRRYSSKFIQEEAHMYDPNLMYEARAKYISYFFEKDLEIWPEH